MSNIFHLHFNSEFESFLNTTSHDENKAVLQTVANISSNIIRNYSVINRCPQKIDDEIRSQVGNSNLIIYTVLKNYALVFIKHRRF